MRPNHPRERLRDPRPRVRRVHLVLPGLRARRAHPIRDLGEGLAAPPARRPPPRRRAARRGGGRERPPSALDHARGARVARPAQIGADGEGRAGCGGGPISGGTLDQDRLCRELRHRREHFRVEITQRRQHSRGRAVAHPPAGAFGSIGPPMAWLSRSRTPSSAAACSRGSGEGRSSAALSLSRAAVTI